MRCLIRGVERNLPDFLIVGAAKCGTTSLHAYLARHPNVVMPTAKETLFFHAATNENRSQLRFLPNAISEFDDYLDEFQQAGPGDICGEACPSYLYYHQHAIPNIKRFHPRWRELKIVIIVREPVDKTISHYFFVKNVLGQTDAKLREESLETSLKLEKRRLSDKDVLPDLLYVDSATYSPQVRAYMEAFPNVRVFLFEQLRDHPADLYRGLCDYLEIQPAITQDKFEVFNQGSRANVPRGPLGRLVAAASAARSLSTLRNWIPDAVKRRVETAVMSKEDVSPETRGELKRAFAADVMKLQDLINADLRSWGYHS